MPDQALSIELQHAQQLQQQKAEERAQRLRYEREQSARVGRGRLASGEDGSGAAPGYGGGAGLNGGRRNYQPGTRGGNPAQSRASQSRAASGPNSGKSTWSRSGRVRGGEKNAGPRPKRTVGGLLRRAAFGKQFEQGIGRGLRAKASTWAKTATKTVLRSILWAFLFNPFAWMTFGLLFATFGFAVLWYFFSDAVATWNDAYINRIDAPGVGT